VRDARGGRSLACRMTRIQPCSYEGVHGLRAGEPAGCPLLQRVRRCRGICAGAPRAAHDGHGAGLRCRRVDCAGERLDPESFRQVMRRYFDTARRVTGHHGGTAEKFLGDAVMAVFGVPVLHEDDALRAVRAAAGLGEELSRLHTQLEASSARP